jgi:Sel1 repeat
MKYFLPLLMLLLIAPVGAQTEDEAYFQRRLEEAKQGDAGAQDNVGTLYAEGRGVQRNDREAVFWLKKSADQGNRLGTCNLALQYARGQGVDKNPVLALKWSLVSHALDQLKCFPDDFVDELKPSKFQIRKAARLALAWLRSHPKLTNEFGSRPWLDDKPQPNKSFHRTRRLRAFHQSFPREGWVLFAAPSSRRVFDSSL